MATPKRTEIEGETLLQVIRESRASKPSGSWSEIACRACVKKRRFDAKRAASNERKLQRTRAVCVPNGGTVITVGQGKGSERTFGLAARGVGFATAAATTTTATTGVCERAARRAGQAGRDRDDARGWAWICGLSVGGGWVEEVVVVTGQSACSSRAAARREGGRWTRQDDRYIQKVRKLMIGHWRENKGRARSQWRMRLQLEALDHGPSTR